MGIRQTVRKIRTNEYEVVKAYEQVAEDILTAATLPKKKIMRILILLGITHMVLLVFLFTTIVTIKYAIQL